MGERRAVIDRVVVDCLGAQGSRWAVSEDPEAKQHEDAALFLRNQLDEAIAEEAKRYSRA